MVSFDFIVTCLLCLGNDFIWLLQLGVVSGKAIFGPQLDDYWKKKLVEEASTKGD
jgi:hypothetical protein